MHNPISSIPRWLLPIVLGAIGLGCSSTDGLRRTTNEPKIRTIASIGDRPVASVTGTPTSSAVADLDPPEPKRDAKTRVSGRVVDGNGDPIPGAKVRVADGGLLGGRLLGAKTDKTGAFTLHGLRPGSTYTLIAELEGQGGLVSGRSEVRSSDTDVEIALQSDDAPADRRRGARTISERQTADDPEPVERPRRVNKEDLPPARDVDEMGDASETPKGGRRVGAIPVSGWRTIKGSRTATAIDDGSTQRASTRSDPGSSPQPSSPPGDDSPRSNGADDGENPLPPAIEPDGPRPSDDPPPGARDATSRRPKPSQRVTQVDPKSPGPPPGALALAKDVSAGVSPPAEVPVRRRDPAHSPATKPTELPDPFAANPAPVGTTWASLNGAWTTLPASESPRPRLIRRDDTTRDRARSKPPVDPAMESCRYDAKSRRIVDFRLPDLEGKPVSFHDIDADLILIDFWGTWCRPCLDSVPHLVELQKKMGNRKLAVVGVACEDGPTSKSAAHVADVAKRLGINYTVLLSTKDGASPVQDALSVQSFPTMILVDRDGRVIWRDQGATPITLARLDRVLDTTTRASSVDRVRR